MTNHWDEFSKSLAEESVPRRESLRRLGAVFAGAVLASLRMGTAWAADPCKTFCNRCPKQKQAQCLAACQACNGNTGRLAGSCGNFVCCSTASCRGVCSDLLSDPNCGACGNNCGAQGLTCCSGRCADLDFDQYNCGACGYVCEPGPYEEGACIDGSCLYQCVQDAVSCDGICTPVLWDPNNCGACGNVCGGATPYCTHGVCTNCGWGTDYCNGICIDILFDALNCGACGYQCQPLEHCSWGFCEGSE